MRLLYAIYYLMAIQVFVQTQAEIKLEENVLVLNGNNFKEAIARNKYLLVNFFVPSCKYCKNFAPVYAKAAKELAEHNPFIKLGKINVEIEIDVADDYDIKRVPTLKFIKSGNTMNYDGDLTAEEIVSWLRNMTMAEEVLPQEPKEYAKPFP